MIDAGSNSILEWTERYPDHTGLEQSYTWQSGQDGP